jgi:GNAT superfamily N-acetyltransferase
MADIVVRAAEPRDEAAWRTLWRDYVEFYEAEVPERITARTWARILAGDEGFVGRVAEQGGSGVVGFTVSIVHAGSWSLDPVCYLEDLYVAEPARGTGVGRALIDDLVNLAQARGWGTLYWHTRESNAAARQLYDAYLRADDFVRYRLRLR